MTKKLSIHPVTSARKYTWRAIAVLKNIMMDPAEKAVARIAAAREILRLGWESSLEVDKMSDEELLGLAESITKRGGEPNGEPSGPETC